MCPKITGIMACDPRGLIGNDNSLPWNYPKELEHFRHMVYGHIIIMGEKTFESVPKDILQGCQSIVFSKTLQSISIPHCTFVSSLDEFMTLPLSKRPQLFMIGGAMIAHLFLRHNLLAEFILTKIHKTYEGNVFLDLNLLKCWPESVICQSSDYTIYKLLNPHSIGDLP